MPDSGSAGLAFIVYVVPGYVVLLAVVYTWLPKHFAAAKEHLGAGEVLASVIGALLIGLFIHQVATFAVNGIDNHSVWPTYGSIVRRFAHVDQVRAKLSKLLGFVPADMADCYFYGRVLISEKAPRVAESSDRLLLLANVCQNMIFALPLAAVVLSFSERLRRKRWVWRFVVPFVIALAIDIVFFYGLVVYWTAAIWRTLRAMLLLT
jgi:hypothetical protein